MRTDMDSALAPTDATESRPSTTPARTLVRRTTIRSSEERTLAALTASELRDFRRLRAGWNFFSAQPAAYQTAMLDWITSATQAATRDIRLTILMNASSNSERSSAAGYGALRS